MTSASSTAFRPGSFALILLSGLTSLLPMAAQAEIKTYHAVLNGAAASPANTSPGTGTCTVTIDTSINTMRVQATFSGLTGNTTAAHIHGPTSVALTGTASVATTTPSFVGFPIGVTSGSMDQTYDLTLASSYDAPFIASNGGTVDAARSALIASLDDQKAYFDIRTEAFTSGEIRAFLLPTIMPGNYPNAGVDLSGSTTVAPDAAPINASYATASTTSDFKGELEVNPVSGVVRVTNAHPAGVYNVSVKVSDANGTTTKAFMLTVTTPSGCGTFGATSFTTAVNYPTGSSNTYPSSVAVGDFNGDGRQDFVAANTFPNVNTVSVFLRDSTNDGFETRIDYAAGNRPAAIAVGDLNGDGRQDLIVGNRGGNISVLFRNSANTGFETPVNLSVADTTNSLSVGDLNGDGKPDIAATISGTSAVSVYYRNSDNTGFEPRVDLTATPGPNGMKIADFNGDGQSDLVVVSAGGTASLLYRNASNTGFESAVNIALPTNNAISVAAGDFNGDGRQDFAVGYFFSNLVSVCLRAADNSGFDGPVDLTVKASTNSIAVGDFNNDGRQDIVTVNSSDNSANVLLRTADNTGFVSPVSFGVGGSPSGVAVGDFNGDNHQDLVSANTNSGNISVLTRVCNTAPGVFNDSYSVGENSLLNVDVANGVLANDTDAEMNALTAILVSPPSSASAFILNPDGSFVYTPNANFKGSDSFTYKANDGSVDSDTANVSITVTETPSLVVTTTSDSSTNTDGLTSLREAITYANTLTGPQTITFSNTTSNGAENFHDGMARTITVSPTNALPNLAVETTIVGPGSERLTVSRSSGQVLGIASAPTHPAVTLSGLTLAGSATFGVANYGSGLLTLTDVVAANFSGRGIDTQGAVIASGCSFAGSEIGIWALGGTGALTVTDCDFSGFTDTGIRGGTGVTALRCKFDGTTNSFAGIFGVNGAVTAAACSFAKGNSGISGGTSVTVTDCSFKESIFGGVFNVSGPVHALRCSFTDHGNSGIISAQSASIADCTITGFQTTGISQISGLLVARNCVIRGSASTSVAVSAGAVVMANCEVSGGSFNGISAGGQGIALTNCTVVNSGNTALRLSSDFGTVTNCTIVGNVVGISGAGNLTLSNSIVAGGSLATISGNYIDGGHNLLAATPAAAGLPVDGTGAVELRNNGGPTNTVAPLAGSPALDGGDNARLGLDPATGQSLAVSGGAGAFTLSFAGQTTNALAWNAAASVVQTELASLPSIGGAGGTVAVTATSGGYTVTFGGSLADTIIPILPSGSGGASVTLTMGLAPLTTDQRGQARVTKGKPSSSAATVDIGAYEFLAVPTFTNDALTLATGSAPLDLAAAVGVSPTGGTFSGTGVSGGTFDPTGLAPGSYTVTYTVNDGFGASNTATFTVSVTELPSLTVTTTSDVVSTTDGQTSLREAITYAATLTGPQTITFSNSTANGAVNFHDGTERTMPGILRISGSTNVIIEGPGADRLTISAGGLQGVFSVDSLTAALTMRDLTVADGSSVVSDNSAGAGITNFGTLTLERCVVRDCIARGAYSARGAGLYLRGPTTIIQCTIAGNQTMTLHSSGRGLGAGIYATSTARVKIINSTISGNNAAGRDGGAEGGGIYAEGGGEVLELINTTVTLNQATGNAGSTAVGGGVGGGVTAANSIIGDNTTNGTNPDVSGTLVSRGHNLIPALGDVTVSGDTTGNLTAIAPLLGPLQENGGPTPTHALLPGSPAIDAGDPAFDPNTFTPPLTTDQRGSGFPRVDKGSTSSASARIDIGAYELFGVPTFTDDALTVITGGAPLDLAAAAGVSPTGGTFSGTGVNGSSFDPTGLALGQYTVTYTVNDGFGASNSANLIVTVTETPSLTVTTTSDSSTNTDGLASLREAVAHAMSGTFATTPEVTFNLPTNDPGYDAGTGAWTITLNGTEIFMNRGITITGPGADKLTVSGHPTIPSRIFNIIQRPTLFEFEVVMTGLTLANGRATNTLTSNGGGAIHSSFEGRFTLEDCVLRDNGLDESNPVRQGGAITHEGALLVLNRCTFTGNSVSGDFCQGGALYANGDVEATETVFRNNQSGQSAGAVWITPKGSSSFADCFFSNNRVENQTSVFGGALVVDNLSPLVSTELTRCVFERNVAKVTVAAFANSAWGGGAHFNTRNVTISDCKVDSNEVSGTHQTSGGGFHFISGTNVTIHRTSVTGNQALAGTTPGPIASFGRGGGIAFEDGSARLYNCTVAGNTASSSITSLGGGIYSGGTLTLTQCTVAGNTITNSTTASGTVSRGGGIYRAGGAVTLANTIIANNAANGGATTEGPDAWGAYTSSGNNLIGKSDGSSGFNASGDLSGTVAAPLAANLGPLGDHGGLVLSVPLLPGSPAIDAGNNALAVDENLAPLSIDQRGQARVIKGTQASSMATVDIGAYELFAAPTFTNDALTLISGSAPLDLATAAGVSPTGGTFSGPGVSGGTFDPTGLALGSYTVTYSVNDGFGAANNATFTVTLAEVPSLTVTTTSDITSNTDGQTSLREALAYSASLTGAQTILFSNSTANGAVNFHDGAAYSIVLDGSELAITGDTTIEGPGADRLAISGDQRSRVFNIANVTTTLRGLSITRGANTILREAHGGGILNAGTLRLERCVVSENTAMAAVINSTNGVSFGGGIYSTGPLTVIDTTITDNLASSPTGVTITDSFSALGGGIYMAGLNLSTPLTIIGSTIARNTVFANGGNGEVRGAGVWAQAFPAMVRNSTFTGNAATGGGSATPSAGAFHFNFGSLAIEQCTISGNSANRFGGVESGAAVLPQNVTIRQTIVAENTATGNHPFVSADLSFAFTSLGYNVVGDTTGTVGWQSTDILAPAGGVKLGPLQNNGGPTETMALLPGSPAIDAGDPAFDANAFTPPLTTDQRGQSRVRGGIVDTGAFESGPARLHIDQNVTGGDGSGESWANAMPELRDATAMAQTDPNVSEIWVARGIYTPSATGERAATFVLRSGLAIYGGFSGTETQLADRDADPATNGTTLSGDLDGNDGPDFANNDGNSIHVVFASGADASGVLDGFTIVGGNADGFGDQRMGGGLYASNGSPTLTNLLFRGNSAAEGGGMRFINGSPHVGHVRFLGNRAGFGGGAAYFSNGAPRLETIEMLGNTGGVDGGALYLQNTALTLTNATIAGNSAPRAGGVFHISATPVVRNSILWSNDAEEIFDEAGGGTVVDLADSIVEGGYAGTNVLDVDPQFVDAPNGNLRLRSTSPAINAGDDSVVTATTDLDGAARIIGAGVDLGAYELIAPPILTNTQLSIVNGGSLVDLADLTGAAPAGGVFSGTGVSVDGNGKYVFDSSGMPLGTQVTVTYTVSGPGGTSNGTTLTITVIETPSLTVTTTIDDSTDVDGETSLREAITHANGLGGAREVTFDPTVFATSRTIAVDTALPAVTCDLTLTGPGVDLLTLADGTNAGVGGGLTILSVTDGSLSVLAMTISGGATGLSAENATDLKISACVLSDHGVAVATGDGVAATILDSTIHDNTTGLQIAAGSSILVINVTLADNGTAIANGGTFVARQTTIADNDTGLSNDLSATLANTICAGNVVDIAGAQPITEAGVNLIGMSAADAGLDPNGLQDNGGPTRTIRLLPGSPALDAGDPAYAIDAEDQPLTSDQRGAGFARVLQGLAGSATAIVDIGAFELFEAPHFTTDRLQIQIDGAPLDLASAIGVTPAGGIFEGPGVSGGYFDPRTQAVGIYEITYTITGDFGIINRSILTIEVIADGASLQLQRTKAFPVTQVGRRSKVRRLGLFNRGDLPASGIRLVMRGSGRKDYKISQPVLKTLAPLSGTTFRASFRPKKPGTRRATVLVLSNAKPVAGILKGRAVNDVHSLRDPDRVFPKD